MDYLTSAPPGLSENHIFADGLREGAELNRFAGTNLISDAKCGDVVSNLIVFYLFCCYLLIKDF